MGNLLCCTPRRYIIDYTQRKIVVSQGIQCTLLTSPNNSQRSTNVLASTNCHTSTTNNQTPNVVAYSSSVCSTEPHHHHHPCTHCVNFNPGGGDTLNCHTLKCCFTTCNSCNTKDSHNAPATATNYQSITNYKSQKTNNNYDHNNNTSDALVSLSETFSDTSLEEFIQRKRLKQNNRLRKSVNTLPVLNENEISKNEISNHHNNNLNELTETNKYKKRNTNFNHKRNNDYNLQNNHNSETSSVLSVLTNENRIVSPVLPAPKKSILKVSPEVRDNKVLSKALSRSMSLCNEKFNQTSNVHRSASVMSSGNDSIDQFLNILKSEKKIRHDDSATGKSVNFLKADVISTSSSTSPTSSTSKFTKTNIVKLSDGRIKKRFLLRETHKLFDILNDPKDRRIRAICDRYQCDMEIFVKPPKIGLMNFAIEILAPDRYSLRMCVRELDSSMRWCISSQMF